MDLSREEHLLELKLAVLAMDQRSATIAADRALDAGLDVREAVSLGLIPGINEVGRRYASGELFIPELLLASDAMYAALDRLKPHLESSDDRVHVRCVLGTVQGDIHDLGKALVKTMLELSGVDVLDLGVDVPAASFVAAVVEHDAQLLCMSSLMTTCTPILEDTIRLLAEGGLRGQVRVLVGGAAVSWTLAEKVGADGYADNAFAAAEVATAWFASA